MGVLVNYNSGERVVSARLFKCSDTGQKTCIKLDPIFNEEPF